MQRRSPVKALVSLLQTFSCNALELGVSDEQDKEMPGATAATAAIRPSKPKRGQRSNRGIWLGLLSIALVLLIWWLVAIALNNESLLPYPSSVWNEFIKDLGNGSLLANSWASLQRVLIGFVIAVISSIPVGFLLGWYSIIRGIAEPVIQFLRVIPPIAIIPLIIVYLGIGEPAKMPRSVGERSPVVVKPMPDRSPDTARATSRPRRPEFLSASA